MASSSSSGHIIDPEEKFSIGNLGLKLIMTSVMLEYEGEHWSGTIVAQKDGKTLVLTVAKVLARVPWESVKKKLTARFYEDQDKKYPCEHALFEPSCNIALFVVDKHTKHKLSFAPENEWDLKELQILGCRGHGWRIATGKVCYTKIKLEDKIAYFGHKLDLRIGYVGAALVNEEGNIVGLQTIEPVDSYKVLSGNAVYSQTLNKAHQLYTVNHYSQQKELEHLIKNVSISSRDLRLEESDSTWIHVPKSEAKLAIHVKYMHGILGKKLKVAGPTIKSLEKALENFM